MQHSMSELPGQYPEYLVPVLQQPAEMDTQTPATPDTVQEAVYEQVLVSVALPEDSSAAVSSAAPRSESSAETELSARPSTRTRAIECPHACMLQLVFK
jgi:hypothetical protein